MSPKAVLFTCDLNRVRSPMAAALLQRLCGDAMRVESCGLEPAEDIDPFVLTVMGEVGLDLTAHRPKSFEVLGQQSFDLLISLTPQAQAKAADLAGERAIRSEYWPTSDPTLESGAREQRLDAYRQVRDELDRRLRERFSELVEMPPFDPTKARTTYRFR
jgi:protein-tyrosine-phosphatase